MFRRSRRRDRREESRRRGRIESGTSQCFLRDSPPAARWNQRGARAPKIGRNSPEGVESWRRASYHELIGWDFKSGRATRQRNGYPDNVAVRISHHEVAMAPGAIGG